MRDDSSDSRPPMLLGGICRKRTTRTACRGNTLKLTIRSVGWDDRSRSSTAYSLVNRQCVKLEVLSSTFDIRYVHD